MPAERVGARLATFDSASATLQRAGSVIVGLIVLVALAREAYRAGYQDGYRIADQVGADRPHEVPA